MSEPLFALEAYDYYLPEDLIARYPAKERHESRLMRLERRSKKIDHHLFKALPTLLQPGDLLVFNDTKVFPARFLGKKPTGGRVEVVLLSYPRETDKGQAETTALVRSSKYVREGQTIRVGPGLEMEFLGQSSNGTRDVRLHYRGHLKDMIEAYGHVPLPPYIKRGDEPEDRTRYQTIYAKKTGSVAAPTAGLHFSQEVLKRLAEKGVRTTEITLHVGYGTFAPVRTEDIREHKIHTEWIDVSRDTILSIKGAKREGKRVICIGTTSVRAIEYVFKCHGSDVSYSGPCDLYIYPGFNFKVTDGMITNFHLPKSSLLILVAAFAGRDFILSAYKEAIKEGYRFYSYGDSMLIL